MFYFYTWLCEHFGIASKHDIGWEHAELFGGNRRTPKCKYRGRVIHGGITRLKQHIAHISGQVEGCRSVPTEVPQSIRYCMSNASNEKIQMKKKKKERIIRSLNEEHFHEIGEVDSDDVQEVEMIDFERRQLKHAIRESRHFFEEGRHGHERGGTSSQPCGVSIKHGPIRSFSIRE